MDSGGVRAVESTVVHGVTIEVPGDGVAAVMGHNGAGKTTLLRAIVGLREGRKLIGDVLDLFPALNDLMPRRAGLLSGGQRQQLAIARALMSDMASPFPYAR